MRPGTGPPATTTSYVEATEGTPAARRAQIGERNSGRISPAAHTPRLRQAGRTAAIGGAVPCPGCSHHSAWWVAIATAPPPATNKTGKNKQRNSLAHHPPSSLAPVGSVVRVPLLPVGLPNEPRVSNRSDQPAAAAGAGPPPRSTAPESDHGRARRVALVTRIATDTPGDGEHE